MPVSTQCETAKHRSRNQVLSAAVVSTLAVSGVSQAALVFPTARNAGPVTSYLGPNSTSQDTVATGNTFQVDVLAFDVTDESSHFVENDAAFLLAPVTVTFGTTTTVTNATSDGETLTITSSETVSGSKTIDKVTFSVPTRFTPIGTTFTNGDLIDEEDLEIGFGANGPGKPLTFSAPVTSAITATGTASYGNPKKKTVYTFAAPYPPYTYLDPTGTMLSADEGLDTLTTAGAAADLTKYNLSSFSFTFNYSTPSVPEPATGAVAMVLGSLGLIRRRRNRAEGSTVDLSSGVIDDGSASTESFATSPTGGQSSGPAVAIEHECLV